MFHVAVFPSSYENAKEEAEVIHESWLLPDRMSSRFPPFMRSKLQNALPADPNWEIYKIKRILHSYSKLFFLTFLLKIWISLDFFHYIFFNYLDSFEKALENLIRVRYIKFGNKQK